MLPDEARVIVEAASGPLQLDVSPFISLLQQRLEARVVAEGVPD